MHNFKITTRLGISITFLLIGLAFLLNAYFTTYTHEIAVLEREKSGVAFLRTATETNQAFTEYRILLYRIQAGEEGFEKLIPAQKEKTEAAYDKLKSAYEVYGKSLAIRPEDLELRKRSDISFQSLYGMWENISTPHPLEVDRKIYANVYKSFIKLSQHVSETSSLIADNDVPSHSLIDASANHITHAMNRVFGFEGKGYDALVKGEPQPFEAQMAAWDLAKYITDYNIEKVSFDIENSLYYDDLESSEASYKQATSDSLAAYIIAGETFSEQLIKSIKEKDLDLAVFRNSALTYKDAMYDLWYKIADQLVVHLDSRITKIKADMLRALFVAGLCCAFALGFFVYIMRDITRSFKALENSMDQIADGELGFDVPYQKYRDEIGHMARTLDRLRQSYWWLRTE